MLPYIDQGPLYNAFNASIGIEGPRLLGYFVNSTVHTTKIASFQCPSDNDQLFSLVALSVATGGAVPPLPWFPTKGNYGVNWGNADYGQGVAGGYFTRNLYLQSPFGLDPTGMGPMTIRLAAVTDGTSNTHFVSEILQGAADDVRGTHLDRQSRRGFLYDAIHPEWAPGLCPPVSTLGVGDLRQCVGLRHHGPSRHVRLLGTGHQSAESRLHVRQPTSQMLACYNQAVEGAEYSGSRSRHPGGVNSLFGDGSVHSMKNSINSLTWVQLGSINGGEVISSDQY